MSSKLEVRLLGTFQVLVGWQPVTHFESDTARALLAYLAARQARLTRREVVAELLWPDRPPGAARKNLRHTLSTLRRSLGDVDGERRILEADRCHISLAGPPQVTVDVKALERLARMSESQTPHLAVLEIALGLYQGPFLEDLVVRGSSDWDQWLLHAREHYRLSAVVLVERLVSAYERMGEVEAGLAAAHRLVELDPWNEHGHRALMRLLAQAGEPAAALSHLVTLRKRLESELQTTPTAESIELADRIRAGALR